MEVFVCKASELPRGGRQLARAGKRNIAVYNHKDRLYAIDNACYHHGGPLLKGDIENLGTHPCVICPWHSYKISLETGEGFYMGIEPNPGGPPKQCVKSKGQKQRTHKVERRGDDIFIFVDPQGSIESDQYAEMAIANQEQPTGKSVTGGGAGGIHSGLRSGHVLGGGRRSLGAADEPQATSLLIRCSKVIPASGDNTIATFVFDKAEGKNVPRLEPGMYVTLELPIGPDGKMERRTWTVSHIRGELGGWFGLTIKRTDPPLGRGGSAWMHQNAFEKTFNVVDQGGTFTINKQRSIVNNRRGAMLLLTAGIGVTPIFASVNRSLTDPFTTVSGPPLHMLHYHVDRTVAGVPLLPQLDSFHQQFAAKDVAADPVSYRLQLHLTGQNAQTPSGIAAPAVAGRPSLDAIIADVKARFAPLGAVLGDGRLNVCVMLCGPQPFMDVMQSGLLAAGIDGSSILTEAFDF